MDGLLIRSIKENIPLEMIYLSKTNNFPNGNYCEGNQRRIHTCVLFAPKTNAHLSTRKYPIHYA